jgi:ankyrin repeat protein
VSQKGTTTRRDGPDSLFAAASSGDLPALTAALEADPWTPLHLAAGNGSVELAEVLLAAGAEVEARGPDGRTPLAIAVERRHDRVADLLRRHGAGPPCRR